MKHILVTTIAAVVLLGCGPKDIWEAAWSGNIEAVKQHLDAGADVNADSGGYTPLHFAATKEIAELLIANGADVNAKDDEGETPLDWASRHRPKTAELLRKHGGKTKKELEAASK